MILIIEINIEEVWIIIDRGVMWVYPIDLYRFYTTFI